MPSDSLLLHTNVLLSLRTVTSNFNSSHSLIKSVASFRNRRFPFQPHLYSHYSRSGSSRFHQIYILQGIMLVRKLGFYMGTWFKLRENWEFSCFPFSFNFRFSLSLHFSSLTGFFFNHDFPRHGVFFFH